MRFLLTLLILPVFMAVFSTPMIARAEGIAAIVNEDAVSMSDLNDRLQLIIVSSGLVNSEEIRAKLAPQVVSTLIEEQLMLQEAARLKLTVTQDEINKGFGTIASQNNMTPEQFQGVLAKSGINLTTMQRQIESQLSWSKVIQAEMRPKVNVTDKDIDEALNRLNASKGTTEYLVAEVFLPVDDPKTEGDTQQLVQRLAGEIRKGAPFFKVAQQFSKAPGASQGGDRGWIQKGQLSQELDTALQSLEKNNISDPIRSPGGYHILLLRDIRQISDASIPSREQLLSTIGVERLDRMQRRYLLDLKSAAFIENRV